MPRRIRHCELEKKSTCLEIENTHLKTELTHKDKILFEQFAILREILANRIAGSKSAKRTPTSSASSNPKLSGGAPSATNY